jgi:signal transduction histidine kinase
MLAAAIHAMEENGRLRSDEIQGIMDSIIRSSPYQFLVLEQNGRRIYQAGDIPASLILPSTETVCVVEGLYVIGHKVSPDKVDTWDDKTGPGGGSEGSAGIEPDDHGYLMILGGKTHNLWHEILSNHALVRIVVIIFFLTASVAAWHMVIRNRILAEQLKVERAHSAHLEELGLAAAGLAHETKNPLGIISGIAQQIISDPEIPEQSRILIDAIIDEVDKSASRLGHFMTFARQRKTNAVQVDIQQLCSGISEILQSEFDAAKVMIEVSSHPMMVLADEDMLRQILVNLLLNSLQASAEGGRVEVRLIRHDERATLEVADLGCGIPPELLPNVFKPYVAGKPDGHGLGLAIVKRFVEDLGWTINIESQLNRGTVVKISDIMLLQGRAG